MNWQESLSDLFSKQLPFSLDLLPPSACLVGGAVRDALLNRQGDYLDLDFVLPTLAVETARKIAQSYQAGFVVLDQQRHIARVVFKDATVDFAQQEGHNLERDLHRRDFTINAIAYNPHKHELIDPLNGLADLEQHIIRMVSDFNLKDDPLRLLRAYRQADQLNFTLEPDTHATLKNLAPLLSRVAPERVNTELGYLLRSSQGNSWLSLAWEDGMLQSWLKNATRESIQRLSQIESWAKNLEEKLNLGFSFPPEHLQIAKLACLVSADSETAETELYELKYSRQEIRQVTTVLKNLPQLQNSSNLMSLREQYFFFLEIKNIFPALALLGAVLEANLEMILTLMHRYLNPDDPVAHPRPLVRGHDLTKDLNLKPSPKIGKLLTELQIAQIEGKIATLEEGINLARFWVDSPYFWDESL